MNKESIAVILVLIILMSGCTKTKVIEHEDYTDFMESMIEKYEYIDDGSIELFLGPQRLYIIYKVNSSDNDYESCFKDTKEFLLEPTTLGKLTNYEGEPYEILEIIISFRSDDNYVNYISDYYNAGPNGYQDNRYWTEDNINGFEEWRIEK